MADLDLLDTESEVPLESSPPDVLLEKRRKALAHFKAQISLQYELQEDKRETWREWLRIYDGKPAVARKDFPWENSSNIVVALAANFVDSVVARVMQGVFSNDPHWVGTQLNRRWAEHVDPLVEYLDWAREYVWDQYSVVKQATLEMCKLGTAVIFNGWKDIPLYRVNSETKQTERSGGYAGPCPEWIPREDFLIPQGFIDIQSAPWVAVRHWFSKSTIQKMIAAGFFKSIPDLEKLSDQDDRIRQTEIEENSDSQPSGLISLWQVWFSDDFDGDTFPEEHILWLHLDSDVEFRYDENPYLGGMRPFIKLTFVEQEGQFDGKGIPDMVQQYQEECSTIHNQRRDNATIANVRGAIARRGSGLSTSQKLYPGVILFASDPKDIVPFQLGEVYPSSQADEQITIHLAEQRVGVNDVNQGQITPPIGRATATTVMSQLQEGTRRFDLNTSELRKALGKQAIQICELYQTHGLPEPEEANSPEQVLDPQKAIKVREIIEAGDQIQGLIALKLNVSTAAINKEIEKQSSVQLMELTLGYYQQMMGFLQVAVNPQMPPAMQQMAMKMLAGAEKMLNQVFKAHQRFDLEDVLLGIGGQDEQGDPTQTPTGVPNPAQGALGGGGLEALQSLGAGGVPGANLGNGSSSGYP